MTDFQNQKERLKTFLSSMNLTNTAFEKSLGLSNGYINSMRKGLGYDKLEQISSLYTDLNMGWLLTGEGKMLKSNPSDSHSNIQSGSVNTNYQGRFNNVHTVIGNNNNSRKSAVTPVEGNRNMVGGAVVEGGAMNNGSAPNNDSITLERCFIENEYLKKEIETLKDRLNQSIIEKDKIMNLLQNVLNK